MGGGGLVVYRLTVSDGMVLLEDCTSSLEWCWVRLVLE